MSLSSHRDTAFTSLLSRLSWLLVAGGRTKEALEKDSLQKARGEQAITSLASPSSYSNDDKEASLKLIDQASIAIGSSYTSLSDSSAKHMQSKP